MVPVDHPEHPEQDNPSHSQEDGGYTESLEPRRGHYQRYKSNCHVRAGAFGLDYRAHDNGARPPRGLCGAVDGSPSGLAKSLHCINGLCVYLREIGYTESIKEVESEECRDHVERPW